MYGYRRMAWEIKKVIKSVNEGRSLEECLDGTSFFTQDAIKKGYASNVLEIGESYNSLLAAGLGTLIGVIALFQQDDLSKIASISAGTLLYGYSILNVAYTKILTKKLKNLK